MGTKECSLFPVGDTAHCLKKPTEVDRRGSSRKERGGRITGIITVKQGVVFFDKGRPLYSFYTRGDLQTLFFAPFPPWRTLFVARKRSSQRQIKKTRHRDDSRRDYYMDEFLVPSSSFCFFSSFFNFDIVEQTLFTIKCVKLHSWRFVEKNLYYIATCVFILHYISHSLSNKVIICFFRFE